jgi:type I restriction enzyme R subunit
MTLEAKARLQIDEKLVQAGWVVQDFKKINLGSSLGVAVREYPTDTGPADYLLFVNRQPVGVIEAKPDSTILTFVADQTERYANSVLMWQLKATPLPFLYESTGQVIHFADGRDPAPRSREIFFFHRPETLSEWLGQPNTLRRRLTENMPVLPTNHLRDCQIDAVTELEISLAQNKPRALVKARVSYGVRLDY